MRKLLGKIWRTDVEVGPEANMDDSNRLKRGRDVVKEA
jgi:hypothetical protein